MLENRLILKGGTVFFEDEFLKTDIALKDGKIVEVGNELNIDGYNIIDCNELIITPGFMDCHVHLRDPGFTSKENITSGTIAALAGGYTTLYAMPNTNPCMDTVKNINEFNRSVKEHAKCNVKTFSAISQNLAGKEVVDIPNISKLDIAGFSDDGKGLQSSEKIKYAMNEIKKNNKILSVHAEDEKYLTTPMGCINEGDISKKYDLIGINNESEYKMLERDINLLKEINCKYHLCHISTKESLELIKLAKNEKLDVTCEVTPHHLILSQEDIQEDQNNRLNTNYKMNPPLRTINDKEALIKGVNDGIIEIIATDHAPHTEEEKNVDISKAPFGITGLETAYSVLNTYLIKENKISQKTILNALTYNPAKRFGVDKSISKGKDVDLVILDPNEVITYKDEDFYSMSSNTPFKNKELKGTIKYTLLKDKIYKWSDNE